MALEGPRILPALVLEYAEYGHLKSFQAMAYAICFSDKKKIAMDVANGLNALHNVELFTAILNHRPSSSASTSIGAAVSNLQILDFPSP